MKYKDEPIYQRKIIGRRGFLKTLGLGLGALAIPGMLLADSGKVGSLSNGHDVCVDPPLDSNVLVGYTGSADMDAGFFYCPYVPIIKSTTIYS